MRIYFSIGLVFINLFLFITPNIHSQSDTSFYYMDKNMDLAPDSNALFIGKKFRYGSLWQAMVISLRTEKKIFNGFYIDSALKVFEGPQEAFYDDGTPQFRKNFDKGKRTGLWKKWDDQGHLTDSALYENDIPKFAYMSKFTYDGVLIDFSYSEYGSSIKKGQKRYSDGGILLSEKEFIDKAGEKKTYYPSGKVSSITKFDEKGVKESARHYKEDGTEISEKDYNKEMNRKAEKYRAELLEKIPAFKGGTNSLNSFFQKNLKLPASFSNTSHPSELITFSFMLDEKGRAYDLKLISPPGIELESALESMVRMMPNWDMKGFKSFGPITQRINVTLQR